MSEQRPELVLPPRETAPHPGTRLRMLIDEGKVGPFEWIVLPLVSLLIMALGIANWFLFDNGLGFNLMGTVGVLLGAALFVQSVNTVRRSTRRASEIFSLAAQVYARGERRRGNYYLMVRHGILLEDSVEALEDAGQYGWADLIATYRSRLELESWDDEDEESEGTPGSPFSGPGRPAVRKTAAAAKKAARRKRPPTPPSD